MNIVFFYTALFVVLDSPLIVQSMDGEYIRVEGLSLTLACHFISNPKADLQWSFNSSTIDNSMNGYNVSTSTHTQIDRVASNTTLSIPNIRRTMQGYYRCDARNHQGITQKMVTVIVHCTHDNNFVLFLVENINYTNCKYVDNKNDNTSSECQCFGNILG